MRTTRERFRTLLALCLAAFAAPLLQAQDEGLTLRYDFEGTSGTSVPDASPSGVTATLRGEAQVEEMGKYHVLDLGDGSGYLDLTGAAGDVFKASDNYTVSVYYRVDEDASLSGNGYFLWSFSTSTACTATEGKYSAYRLNAQRFANSTGGFNNEFGLQTGSESEKGRWIHVAYTQNGATGVLYIDGRRRSSVGNMPLNSANFTASIPYAWIGRAPFTADNYLRHTLVYDFRLYNKALTAEEVEALAALTADLDTEYRYGNAGDFTALRENIEEGRRFVAGHGTEYPALSLLLYEDELNMAQDLADEGLVNQNIIDEQLQSLAAARTALEASKGFVLDESGTSAGYDTDRGFRHPGALHTDEDFARIRRQLQSPEGSNEDVKAAYEVLVNAEYAQSGCATYPVETIIRGVSGENYINAARGATIAYQNALRWKIDGSEAHARHAVDVLMAWARTTKALGGNTNVSLASGLYGYQFANAAELMRDYEGWSREDFAEFKRWMLDVWYPVCTDFLRRRHDTWQNSANIPNAGHGKDGERPGHYWSNWGLCNALAVMSIGILCDDVFIYNQGLSFYKYDQVDSFTAEQGSEVRNSGLTEFLGNLVPAVHQDDRGPYGYLGQLQESGRDQGHASMALGLAVDICQTAWNQGDDLFSYMDNRLAAGIEFHAAYNSAGIAAADLPWTTYCYADCRTAWHNSWRQTGISGDPHGARPYWGRIVGHYEGIKGVPLPYAEQAKKQMGIDGGGTGGTSGGYDHLGYSVLTGTRDSIGPDQAPTLLTPQMETGGTVVGHNELGGLSNTYELLPTSALTPGTVVTLRPQLPDGTSDTGLWQWDTGETTKDLTVTADESRVYRVTYTNEHGVESQQVFTLAVAGDCEESRLTPHITYNGTTYNTSSLEVLYGSEVTLALDGGGGWGFWTWEDGSTASSLTLPHVTSSRQVSVVYTNQGGRRQKATFTLSVQTVRPDITVDSRTMTDTTVAIVEAGSSVTLTATATSAQPATYLWSDGSTGASLTLEDVQTSGTYTVEYATQDESTALTFHVYVPAVRYSSPAAGVYYIRHTGNDTYLTNPGGGTPPVFAPRDESDPESQQWRLGKVGTIYNICSLADSTYLNPDGELTGMSSTKFRFSGAIGTEQVAILGNMYWRVATDGTIDFEATEEPNDYPFELIPADSGEDTGIDTPQAGTGSVRSIRYYTPEGIRLDGPRPGLLIRQTTYSDGRTETEKLLVE